MNDAPSTSDVQTPIKKNRGWIWYFAFLIVASAAAAGTMIWFNKSIQLTPEKLGAARALWQQKGPRDYTLRYTKQLNQNANIDTFVATVRAGTVVEVLMNGKPLEANQWPYHSMDGIYRDVVRFMELDSKPGSSKVFVSAIFDNETGALRKYIRSDMKTRDRVELNLTLEAPAQ
jgi:hypothetical protein